MTQSYLNKMKMYLTFEPEWPKCPKAFSKTCFTCDKTSNQFLFKLKTSQLTKSSLIDKLGDRITSDLHISIHKILDDLLLHSLFIA